MRREVLFHKCDSFLREKKNCYATSAHRVDVPRAKAGPQTRFSATTCYQPKANVRMRRVKSCFRLDRISVEELVRSFRSAHLRAVVLTNRALLPGAVKSYRPRSAIAETIRE